MAITPPAGGYCTNCSAAMNANSVACLNCGFAPFSSRNFCHSCAKAVNSPNQAMCTGCGSALSGGAAAAGSKSKSTAGILAILLGAFGAHKFYLGRTNPALIMLAAWVVGFCGGVVIFLPYVLCFAVWVVGIIEGIIMLGKSDAQFQQEYVIGQKDWF